MEVSFRVQRQRRLGTWRMQALSVIMKVNDYVPRDEYNFLDR